MMRLVAPWGFYGMGNTGDEGTVCGFARLLKLAGSDARVTLGCGNPRHCSRVEPAFRYFGVSGPDVRRYWAKLRATAHAVLGGTPIMDVLGDWPLRDVAPLVRAAERWKVPFVFIGCGVEDLRLDQSLRVMREGILPRVPRWTVRCNLDRERLIRYGAAPEAVTVAADVAWLIEPVSKEFGAGRLRGWGINQDRPLIGVNVANENACFERQPEMTEALAKALDRLIESRQATVLFLCAEVREGPTFDLAAARLVRARMRQSTHAVIAPNEYFSPRQLMSVIACCSLTLSMRYHFCIFSALQSVPFIAIRRADKITDLCWDLNWEAQVLPPRFESDEIVFHADQLDRDVGDRQVQLQRSIGLLKERAMENVAALEWLASNS